MVWVIVDRGRQTTTYLLADRSRRRCQLVVPAELASS